MTYYVYGDYGLDTETLLEEFDNLEEAIHWAKRYTYRDLGGYEIVEVASFTKDGEYVTHWLVREEWEE